MKLHFPTINQFVSLLIFSITNAVFQLMVIPILVHHINAEKLGVYFLALSFGSLIAIFVNYGTMQTSMVEIKKAVTMEDKKGNSQYHGYAIHTLAYCYCYCIYLTHLY